MILRRITKHVKDQNWFAVGLDFFIVVFGVFVGLQVQQWALERQRQNSEGQYLMRLHGEVELLIASRASYDETRPRFSGLLGEAVDILASGSDDIKLTQAHCDAIAGSSHMTTPPADLPTIRELLSSGRLDQIQSIDVRAAILVYTQHVARARDLIAAISDHAEDLSRHFPALIKVHYGPDPDRTDRVWINPVCDTLAMSKDIAFLNGLGLNAYQYKVYTDRAVLPVSRELAKLHETLDQALDIKHDGAAAVP
ncbi:MAG: hypothetical protein COA60_004565 [Robiginitomaculum sp.]|nr:hypothetical protein [Robiginitomaculum sp.]MBL4853396.1 hypothetical protein [Robiginitomaculum sp.]